MKMASYGCALTGLLLNMRDTYLHAEDREPPARGARDEVQAPLREAVGDHEFGFVPNEAGKLLADIQAALDGDDLHAAQKVAHSLKGLAGNFSAIGIASRAKEFEFEAATADAKVMIEGLQGAIEDDQSTPDDGDEEQDAVPKPAAAAAAGSR